MAFADFVTDHEDRALKLAEENQAAGEVVMTLIEEWQQDEAEDGYLIVY